MIMYSVMHDTYEDALTALDRHYIVGADEWGYVLDARTKCDASSVRFYCEFTRDRDKAKVFTFGQATALQEALEDVQYADLFSRGV